MSSTYHGNDSATYSMADRCALEEFAKLVPKCELHLHIEGTLDPITKKKLAERNSVIPRIQTQDFIGLQSFLDSYYDGLTCLRTADDFFDLTFGYFTNANKNNVMHAEIHFDPQAHISRGIPFETVITGIRRGQTEALKVYSITSRLILAVLRDRPVQEACSVLKQAVPFIGWIDAVGLDSAEAGNPCSAFVEAFALAETLGLKATAHAGEEGPPSNLTEALDMLKASRIDHGVRSVEDPSLFARLKKECVPLTVCPLSNVKLKVVQSLAVHPLLHASLIRGDSESAHTRLNVTINSDDPAYFGGDVNENLLACVRTTELGWCMETLLQVVRNSVEASFASTTEKAGMLKRIEVFNNEFGRVYANNPRENRCHM